MSFIFTQNKRVYSYFDGCFSVCSPVFRSHFVETAGQFGLNELHALIGDSLEVISRISWCNHITISTISEVLPVLFLQVLSTLVLVLGSAEASLQ